MALAFALVSAFIAAVIQRITGLGFVLVLLGPLVLLYGAREGVTVAVLLALAASVSAVPFVWREVEWRRSAWLILPGLAAAPLGAVVVSVLPEPALLLLIGVLACFALTAGRVPGLSRALVARRGAVTAGAVAGFMHVTSGLSGPPLAAHAVGDRWPQRSFAASVQIVFVAFSAVSVALRGLPSIGAVDTVALLAVTVTGIAIGTLAARRVPAALARRGMLAIAWAGALVVIGRGIAALVT